MSVYDKKIYKKIGYVEWPPPEVLAEALGFEEVMNEKYKKFLKDL